MNLVEVTPENLEQVLAQHGCHGPDWGLLPHRSDYRDTQGTDGENADESLIEGLFRHLDGETQTEQQLNETSKRAEAVEMLGTLFDWIAEVSVQDARAVKSIGLRSIAALWVINPDKFGGMSAREISEKMCFSRQVFHTHAASFSRQFGVRNRFQVHDWQN